MLSRENKKPWVIVGAGPVGAMQAVILATLFPGQTINILDKRETHVRNHGLFIWHSTIQYIIEHLTNYQLRAQTSLRQEIDETQKAFYQKRIDNIQETVQFLKEHFPANFIGDFIATKEISQLLQKRAEILGVKFHMGEKFGVTPEILQAIAQPISSSTTSASVNVDINAKTLLQEASVIFGADGAHSQIRATLFNEPEPEEERVIQHLIEIKLQVKAEKKPKLMAKSEFASEFTGHSILPSIKTGELHVWNKGTVKEGASIATLHILVNESVFNELRSKKNLDGTPKGTYLSPYKNVDDLPAGQAKKKILNGIELIGKKNIIPDSLAITTIPMRVYRAKGLVKQTESGKQIGTVGDAGTGLIFVQGVNTGIACTTFYADALEKMVTKGLDDPTNEVEVAFKEAETEIFALYEQKVTDILTKKTLLDIAKKPIEATKKITTSSGAEEDIEIEASAVPSTSSQASYTFDLDPRNAAALYADATTSNSMREQLLKHWGKDLDFIEAIKNACQNNPGLTHLLPTVKKEKVTFVAEKPNKKPASSSPLAAYSNIIAGATVACAMIGLAAIALTALPIALPTAVTLFGAAIPTIGLLAAGGPLIGGAIGFGLSTIGCLIHKIASRPAKTSKMQPGQMAILETNPSIVINTASNSTNEIKQTIEQNFDEDIESTQEKSALPQNASTSSTSHSAASVSSRTASSSTTDPFSEEDKKAPQTLNNFDGGAFNKKQNFFTKTKPNAFDQLAIDAIARILTDNPHIKGKNTARSVEGLKIFVKEQKINKSYLSNILNELTGPYTKHFANALLKDCYPNGNRPILR